MLKEICDLSRLLLIGAIITGACFSSAVRGQNYLPILNDVVDLSSDFHDFKNTYFLADSLVDFDPETASGTVEWKRNLYQTRHAFNNMLAVLQQVGGNEFPAGEYAVHPRLPFSIEFVSPRTVRLRMQSGPQFAEQKNSLMLVNGEAPENNAAWTYTQIEGGHKYTSEFGAVVITNSPWHIAFYDAEGTLLTQTHHKSDNSTTLYPALPFSFVRRSQDYSRSMAAVFDLAPGEKIFGCGESFTKLDKRGQKVNLWLNDPNGSQTDGMYKPIPFFMSSRGYGMFMHTSTPITCDFGQNFNGTTQLLIGDDALDLFIFMGEPKAILDAYTTLTGKAAMPPLWSFGLWMSRITYFSEEQVRDVASKLREHRIPSDVIHLDTGWFETDWRCDYEFSPTRFKNAQKMIADLKDDGFRTSLWQLPYFVPKNRLFPEIIQKGIYVKDAKGNLPFEDAVLDFSNPDAVNWYQDKIAGLLKLGVGAIKVDFGEAAPYNGLYHSGRTGFYEHNLYPLRYNKTVAEITQKITGDQIIWARSTWAGSQRYPIHWGGDAGTSDNGMATSLLGGLSIGLSGFSFWSHDMGGFPAPPPEELYSRWTPFGMLTSHSRSHGTPPKEPWLFSEDFLNGYRKAAELKYKLMPYVYAQAKACTEAGLPMVRALFVEYPDDPGSWLVEDAYLFGSDILVAPLLHANASSRDVYLPPGEWIDYQTGKSYSGGWHHIAAGDIPVVMLVKAGTVLPHIGLAQSTKDMDWSKLELRVFAGEKDSADGLICLPSDNVKHALKLVKSEAGFTLENDPLAGKVEWAVRE